MEYTRGKGRITTAKVMLIPMFYLIVSCSSGSNLLDAVNDSRIRGKNLNILVVCPFMAGSEFFSSSHLSRDVQAFFIEGLYKLDEEYRWSIRGRMWKDEKVTRIFYKALTDSEERRNFLRKIIEKTPYNQVLFSRYKSVGAYIEIRLYLYDKEDDTLGKAPISGYRKIRWKRKRKEGAAEDVARLLRDLISRHFTS